MKKIILFVALIASLGFSDTLVVDKSVMCSWFFGCLGQCTDATNDNDYYHTVSDALNNAKDGDEIIICPDKYNESNLNIAKKNLNIHSYKNNLATKIYDNSGNPIFNITKSGITLQALSIEQQYNQMDINVTGNIDNLSFKDLNITSEGKGIVLQENVDNNFTDVNITSKDRCFENDWSEFHGVIIKNSEFNQTSSGKYAFVEYATNFYDNNFTNVEINSSGYGARFGYGFKDSNFTNFRVNSDNDPFVVDNGNMDNIRFIDSNISTANGRGISISDGNLTNSYFSDFNISSYWEGIYTDEDINNSIFSNFIIKASTGFYSNEYIKKSKVESGYINATQYGIYSSKEFNKSTLNDLNITAGTYGVYLSENSASGAVNDENNLTNLNITQTGSGSSKYSAIRFKKRVNHSLFKDINISATERGIWFSTGGYYNTLDKLEINSSKREAFVNNGLIYDNNFTDIKTNTYKVSFSFRGDVKHNTFNSLNLHSDKKSGIYDGDTSDNISDNTFNKITINSGTHGIYLKSYTQDNNFTNVYMRVNKRGFKFQTYSINNYFYDIDTNGTKGFDFNISEGDEIRKITAYTTQNEPIYFSTIENSPVKMYDLNLTSTKDNCIYVKTLDDNLSISTIDFDMNELNCSDYNGIQISDDSDKNLTVLDTNFSFNADSSDIYRALIKVKSLDTLYLKNNIFDADNKIRGVYIKNSLNNFYAYNNNFTDLNNSGIYIKQVNDNLDIEDNNITNSVKWGIIIKSVGDDFNKGEIKNNIIKNCNNYGVDIFYGNENDDAKFEVWKNCFYQNHNNSYQAYTNDLIAKYDDGSEGNYWSDWSGEGNYSIDPIPIYDNHPLKNCPLSNNNASFNAVTSAPNGDAIKDWDQNLTTKIVNDSFDIYILSQKDNKSKEANITKVIFEGYDKGDGTSCSGLSTNTTICDNSDSSNKCDETNSNGEWKKNIKITSAYKCAEIYIEGNFSNSSTIRSTSTDDFVLRPYEFNITHDNSKIYAGDDFNLTFKAVDKNKNEVNNFDENNYLNDDNTSFNLTPAIKDGCKVGDFKANVKFNNGTNTTTATYSENGDFNITITDINYSDVDKDDTPKNERIITSNTINLTSYPYEINTTTSFNKKTIIYDDKNLSNFYAEVNSTVKVSNKQGDLLDDFNSTCFGSDLNVSYTLDENNISKSFIGMYVDKNDTNFTKLSVWTISKDKFNSGEGNLSVKFNIDKNYSEPLSVKEINFTEANVSTDLAKYQPNEDLNKSFRFYYTRLVSGDINLLNEKNGSTIVKVAIYDDKNYFDKNKVLINWYLDENYTRNDVSVLGVEKGYLYDEKNVSDVKSSLDDFKKGESNLSIENNNSNINFVVVHLKTPYFLWYSKYSDYNDSNKSGCISHYCVEYHTNNDNNEVGVGSGIFVGSEINTTQKIKKKIRGVRIYR